jgi:rRNA-processing protein FCF1
MNKFILDSNVYDLLLASTVSLDSLLNKGEFYITNVQISEIKNIPNEVHKCRLLKLIKSFNQVQVNLESGVWLDDLYWDDDQIWIDGFSESFKSLLGNSKGVKKYKDALIGEVAKRHSLILVTNDINFQKKAKSVGIIVMGFNDLLII